MTSTLIKHKLTCHQYHQMAETGILAQGDRLELIHGEIIDMSPIGRKHNACIARLTELFVTRLHGRAIVWVQNSISLDYHSEPQPDVALLKPCLDFYEQDLPMAQDVLLLVEVADSSINYDLDIKMPLYAEAGITELWLIDLNSRTLISYTLPDEDGYTKSHRYRFGDSITIQAFPNVEIAWSDIFGGN